MAAARYLWRKLSPAEREDLLAWRKFMNRPWRRPPHLASERTRYHICAACYEHAPHIGFSPERMKAFCDVLLGELGKHGSQIHAWCVLPNHYHALVETQDILALLDELGRMHGRLSFQWNGEEKRRGRQVWCGAVERFMRNDGHFWATLNYVHHNPVRHGYVDRWQEWPFSSAKDYLEQMGQAEAARIWQEYPLLDYGTGWDDPEM